MGGQFVAKAHGVGLGFAYSIFVLFKRPVAYLEWHKCRPDEWRDSSDPRK